MCTHPQEGFRIQQLVSQKSKGLMGFSALLGQKAGALPGL